MSKSRIYVGTRGCMPTAGVSSGCLLTTIAYAVVAALAFKRARR